MPVSPSTYNWFFKYKLYHLPFWFLYQWMWWSLVDGNPLNVVYSIFSSAFAVKFAFYLVFQAAGVYFNLYFLMPRFLDKGRYVEYILFVMLTIICVAALIVPGYYVTASLLGKSTAELFGTDPHNKWFFFKANTLPSATASMTLAMTVKITKKWIQTQQRQRLLEKEKIETELKFLKSQFNPHFLFNTINSIFVLIHKDPLMASSSLAKFSDLLRYQLYECNEQHIPLAQEVTYLHNFIELEKLRQEKNITMQLQIQPVSGDLTIAPFILMPFIENAFKHISHSRQQENYIIIQLHTDQDQLYFELKNSIVAGDTASASVIRHSGIGLKNVQRRLDLLYPGRHELTIKKGVDQFHVSLRLQLSTQQSEVWPYAV